MTALVEDLLGLPDWPALLSAEQASAYTGISRDSFHALVEKGYFPTAVSLPIRRKLWSRVDIDAAIARNSGNSAEAREREWQRRKDGARYAR